MSFDVHHLQLIRERVEQGSRVGRLELPGREPLPEIIRRGRAIRAQVAAAHLTQAFVLVELLPTLHPLVRAGERDLASLRWPLAENGAAEEGEARQQAPFCLWADALHDPGGEFLAQQATAVERVQHRVADLFHVIASERRVQLTFRIDPRFQLLRLARPHGSCGRQPQRQIVSRMEVEGAAQRPRLHELPAFPERVADVLLHDPIDARRELQLRRRLNLRVHAADVVNDFEQTVRARSPRQEAARKTTRANRVPGGQGR